MAAFGKRKEKKKFGQQNPLFKRRKFCRFSAAGQPGAGQPLQRGLGQKHLLHREAIAAAVAADTGGRAVFLGGGGPGQ